MQKFLIVKLSSLGDILHSLQVVDYLKSCFPNSTVDWVVEEAFAPIVVAHPKVRKVWVTKTKKWRKQSFYLGAFFEIYTWIRNIRKQRYDVLFDLQGNSKSGVVTFFAKSSCKVGFGKKSLSEWPNFLMTHHRHEVDQTLPIAQQYLSLIQKEFQDFAPFYTRPFSFVLKEKQQEQIDNILKMPVFSSRIKMMVCPGSNWENKRLTKETLIAFLQKLYNAYHCGFLVIWGTQKEQQFAKIVQDHLPEAVALLGEISVPFWQRLMQKMDGVISVDSSALHLCGTTQTPSFSIFGPSSASVYKPDGEQHSAYQGICPYHTTFTKRCPLLRTCKTGACIKMISADDLFASFQENMKLSSKEESRV